MGWGSATVIFDGAVDMVLLYVAKALNIDTSDECIEDSTVYSVVRNVYTEINWGDWDTQDESKYFDPYLMEVMRDLDELD